MQWYCDTQYEIDITRYLYETVLSVYRIIVATIL